MVVTIQERIAAVLRRHSITDAPTWANERICLCGKTVRVMPPGPDFHEHVAEVLTKELGIEEFACGDERWWSTRIYRGECA
jgi:hypothetical protein